MARRIRRCVDVSDKEFDEAMTLSGSKVELTVTTLGAEIPEKRGGGQDSVHGKATRTATTCGSARSMWDRRSLSRSSPAHGISMWAIWCPWPCTSPLLPGGVKIEKGKLRGVVSNGMLCSLKELNLTAEHDYPYAVITPAALLNDYQAPGPGEALHPRRHQGRGQGVRPRGLRQGAGM